MPAGCWDLGKEGKRKSTQIRGTTIMHVYRDLWLGPTPGNQESILFPHWWPLNCEKESIIYCKESIMDQLNSHLIPIPRFGKRPSANIAASPPSLSGLKWGLSPPAPPPQSAHVFFLAPSSYSGQISKSAFLFWYLLLAPKP